MKSKIIEKLKSFHVKERFTVAVTPTVLKSFKKECKRLEIGIGPTIEELMKEFIEENDSEPTKVKVENKTKRN